MRSQRDSTSVGAFEVRTSEFMEVREDPDDLRKAVRSHLKKQGFVLTKDDRIGQAPESKDAARRLHELAVLARRNDASGSLANHEDRFVQRLVKSSDLDVSKIRPALRLVDSYKSPDAPLWRWAALHWSVPVSAGYGRRLRFLVVDEGHDDALMGLIGLHDPVFSMACRDGLIGWSVERRKSALSSVMDAFVLGAVPPYQGILGGKLVAALAASKEVQLAFADRYQHRTTIISDRDPNARLAVVTTSSALGRSSMYNRLQSPGGGLVFERIGMTAGSGDFHLSGVIYDRLYRFAVQNTSEGETARHERWSGTSFRNRKDAISRALRALGFPEKAMRYHGVKREVFLAQLGSNSFKYLRGETSVLRSSALAAVEHSDFWLERWAAPRAAREGVPEFVPDDWRLFT